MDLQDEIDGKKFPDSIVENVTERRWREKKSQSIGNVFDWAENEVKTKQNGTLRVFFFSRMQSGVESTADF